MAFPYDCNLDPGDISDVIASQVSVLKHDIIRFNALNDPYANVIEGGSAPNNSGTEIKTLVTSRMVTNQSLTAPSFSPTIEACGTRGPTAEPGQTLFTTQMKTLRGLGPKICVKQAMYSVADSYRVVEQNLKDAIKSIMAADTRNNLLQLAGVKGVLKSGATNLGQLLSGGYNQVAVNFVGGLPTAPVTHKFLVHLSHYMRDTLSPEFFGEGAGQHFVFVAGSDQIEKLRNETGLKTETLAFVQGSDASAKEALKRYAFIEYPYRGIKLAIDQQPLRFNVVDGNGFPVAIEPLIEAATDYGVENVVNPDWVSAQYEVGFLISKGSFKRLVPEKYLGEGSFKWPAQFVMGELDWHLLKDNECNVWADYGFHKYQIERAFQARRPHGVIPLLYKRCSVDLGLSDITCSDLTDETV
jgi:hypothetical protein